MIFNLCDWCPSKPVWIQQGNSNPRKFYFPGSLPETKVSKIIASLITGNKAAVITFNVKFNELNSNFHFRANQELHAIVRFSKWMSICV